MGTRKNRVRVKTGEESLETYELGEGQHATVKTEHEKPEVSIGGGGGAIGGAIGGAGGGCLSGCIAVVIVLNLLVWGLGYLCNRAMKAIDPTWKSEYEIREEEENKKREKERLAQEKEKEKAERPQKIMDGLRTAFQKIGEDFLPYGICELGQDTWVCGNFRDRNFNAQLAVIHTSTDERTWKVLAMLDKEIHYTHPSSIYFCNRQEGYMSAGYLSSDIFKTSDGGKTWVLVVTTGRMGLCSYVIKKVHVQSDGTVVAEISSFGSEERLMSSDNGKSWLLLRDGVVVNKTFTKGMTWTSDNF